MAVKIARGLNGRFELAHRISNRIVPKKALKTAPTSLRIYLVCLFLQRWFKDYSKTVCTCDPSSYLMNAQSPKHTSLRYLYLYEKAYKMF